MNKFPTFLGIALAAVLLSSPVTVHSQQANTSTDLTFTGPLVSVDTIIRLITAKRPDDNKEMTFAYTKDTTVVGPGNTVEGLAEKAGSQIRIIYRDDFGANLATRIELIEPSRER